MSLIFHFCLYIFYFLFSLAHKDALKLSAEFLRLFTIEALHRAVAYQREQEEDDLLREEEILLDVESLEAVTPQLLLDF